MKSSILDAIKWHKKAIADFEDKGTETVSAIAEMIVESYRGGGCVYLCGNGGSAADAQHIAGELIGRFRKERRALAAVALTTDTSILTCLSNDYGFDDVFRRQVEGLLKPGDILWAFSTSGTSANILAAAKLAKSQGGKVIAFTGKANSELENISDICLCADCEVTSTSQEVHQLAYHIICDLVEQAMV